MVVTIERACTFTVPLAVKVGEPHDRVRVKPGEVIEVPDDVAAYLEKLGLASPGGMVGMVADGPTNALPPAAPFDAQPVENAIEPEPVDTDSRFSPPQRPGGLRSFIRQPR